jgi:hypothetical protein
MISSQGGGPWVNGSAVTGGAVWATNPASKLSRKHAARDSNEGEQHATRHMGLTEVNKLWGKLKGDSFKEALDKERERVQDFVAERIKRHTEAAEASRKRKERELDIVERLKTRVMQERQEADETVARAEKERAEFERAVQVFNAEKENLERIVQEAERDGVVDDDEANAIVRWRVEVQTAAARLEKERHEYEDWSHRARRQIEEAIAMSEKCKREIEQRTRARNLGPGNLASEVLSGTVRSNSCMSVLDRIEVYALSQGVTLPDLLLYNQDDMWLCKATLPKDSSGYAGEWACGHPDGSGSETLQGVGAKYLGRFEADMRHGIGVLMLLKRNVAYAGFWAKGSREGNGIVCHIRPDGSAIPIVFCTCKDNVAVSEDRFSTSNKAHVALVDECRREIQRAMEVSALAIRVCGDADALQGSFHDKDPTLSTLNLRPSSSMYSGKFSDVHTPHEFEEF